MLWSLGGVTVVGRLRSIVGNWEWVIVGRHIVGRSDGVVVARLQSVVESLECVVVVRRLRSVVESIHDVVVGRLRLVVESMDGVVVGRL